MNTDYAEIVATQVLGWIAGEDDMFPALLAATGTKAADLRTRADDPQFLSTVLDFLMQKDWWVMDFCAQNDMPFDSVVRARIALPDPVSAPAWA